MIVGVPKEIKNHEYRVGMVPSGVKALFEKGHKVIVQKSAGEGAGVSDAEYLAAGGAIKQTAKEVFDEAEMIVKVKEPQPVECGMMRENQILFTYLHLAPAPDLTRDLLKQKIIGLAYETVQLANGSLPLLTPMSEVAGKLSVQVGAHYLQKENGGSGVLLGGVPGVKSGRVVIIGGGTVGTNAAKVALGMGANVTILDVSLDRLRYLSDIFGSQVQLLASNDDNIEEAVAGADVVIGALLVAGARAKKMVSREIIGKMRRGSVMVDVAIDQGGCFETSIPTTHEKPVFQVEGVIQYCVANMPGCVSRSSTFALANATLPYALKIADCGYQAACECDAALRKGMNVFKGKLTNKAVADSLGIEYVAY
jgi:alanine dehydrogenase